MERRWNLKFESVEDKLELLGLNFMAKKED